METRPLGQTGLRASVLGFGAIQVGTGEVGEARAGTLLNRVLDAGITLIDTARSYGLAEERIGRHLAHRRGEFVLSTKVGYGVEGCHDWTHECVAKGVDAALRRLRTDHIEIVHLHSCPVEVLENNGVLDALETAREAGKITAVAYSGDNDALDWVVADGRVQAIQTSINLCDQRSLGPTGRRAAARGMAVLAKRVMANAPWRPSGANETSEEAEYRRRFAVLRPSLPAVEDWAALALRFVVYSPLVGCALIGTANPAHLATNVAAAEAGPLPDDVAAAIAEAWRLHGGSWRGII
jgi:aryl-alcohol dehydrogenase-like predicted oxidoreductase